MRKVQICLKLLRKHTMSAHTQEKSMRFQQAMVDVRDRCMSIREAAAKWQVAKTSLHNRASGKVEFDRRSGRSSI